MLGLFDCLFIKLPVWGITRHLPHLIQLYNRSEILTNFFGVDKFAMTKGWQSCQCWACQINQNGTLTIQCPVPFHKRSFLTPQARSIRCLGHCPSYPVPPGCGVRGWRSVRGRWAGHSSETPLALPIHIPLWR